MKTLSWYVLAIFLLLSIPTGTQAVVETVNPLFGYVSFVINDLPQSVDVVDGCKCENGYIYSGDRQFKKKCACGENCKCPKHEDKGSVIKSDDCDIIKSMNANSPYRKFLPKQKGKELWCLSTSESWCQACNSLKYEFSKMKRTGWTFDEKGDLTTVGNFHIRLIDFEKFEGFPSYFFEVEKDKDGNIIMNKEGQSKESLSLPTLVYFEDGKVKTVHIGFLNSFGMLKLFEGKPIIKGVDDIPTK